MNSPDPASGPLPAPRISYAQNMEDILLDRFFMDQRGTYMDVGANHPVNDNNTYFFYQRGWRGVNLEPIPRLHELFVQPRPQDLNLPVAASDKDAPMRFYEVPAHDGLSTLCSDIANDHRRRGFEVIEYEVPARTIASLVKEHGISPPDLLSIDVEGREAEVLRAIPFAAWRPRVLVIESTLPMSQVPCHQSWESILLEQDYVFAAFNGVNRFYVRGDLRDRLSCFETPVNVLDNYRKADVVGLAERTTRAELARAEEKARFEELRTAWESGREQAAQTQAAWQQTRADWDQERSAWRKERELHAETVGQLQRQVQDAAAQCQAHERALAEQCQAQDRALAEQRHVHERALAEL